MITPTKREVARTPAAKVTRGATLWGGYYDGATVQRVVRIGWGILLLLDDGRELRQRDTAIVAWLHPAGKTSR